MKVAAFIPARGGSERVPGKNLRTVGGRSLLWRAIEVVVEIGLDEVVVSTDSEGIVDHAILAHRTIDQVGGVRLSMHMRRPEHATSTAQIEDAIADWWDGLAPDARPDAVVLLQPTSPLRRAAHVQMAVEALERGYETAIGVRDVSMAVAFSGEIVGVGTVSGPDYIASRAMGTRPRSQDVPRRYAENGAIYAWMAAHWAEYHDRMWGAPAYPVVMSEIESFDVDDEDDLRLADAVARGLGL